jgi:hypothetical protein
MTDPFAADAEALAALDLPTIAGLLSASATTVAAELSGLARPPGGAPRASMSSWANGSTTTATTSGSCSR